jgi:hypothetical protein
MTKFPQCERCLYKTKQPIRCESCKPDMIGSPSEYCETQPVYRQPVQPDTKPTAPREFELFWSGLALAWSIRFAPPSVSDDDEYVKVMEYSAYASLKAELDFAIKANALYKESNYHLVLDLKEAIFLLQEGYMFIGPDKVLIKNKINDFINKKLGF